MSKIIAGFFILTTMARNIFINAVKADMAWLIEEPIGIISSKMVSNRKTDSADKENTFKVSVDNHDRELEEGRSYTAQEFINAIGWDYERPTEHGAFFFKFTVYKRKGIVFLGVAEHVTSNEKMTAIARGIRYGCRILKEDVIVYIYRRTTKGNYHICGSLGETELKVPSYIK